MPTPTYVATIAGVTRTIGPRLTLSIRAAANNVHTLTCEMDLLDGLNVPTRGQSFSLTEDAALIFGGKIQGVTLVGFGTGAGASDAVTVRLVVVSYTILASRRYLTITLPAGMLKSQFEAVRAAGLDDYGTTLDAGQVDGPSMPGVIFTLTRTSDILTQLCDVATNLAGNGFVWDINYSNVLKATHVGDDACPFDITDLDANAIGDIEVEETYNDQYANHIIGSFSGAGPATSTETFTAADGVSSGGFTRFTSKYPAVTELQSIWPNVLIINSVVLEPIGWVPFGSPFSAFPWQWDPAAHQLIYDESSGAPFPAGSDEISITYAIGYPFTLESDGGAAPADRVDFKLDIAQAATIDGGQALLDAELARRMAAIRRVTYATEQLGALPGQAQTINIARRGVNATFLLDEVDTRNTSGNRLARTISAIESTVHQPGWRGTVQGWTDSGGGSSGGVQASVGGGGSAVAPPLESVQSNQGGALSGDKSFKFKKAQHSIICGDLSSITAASYESCQVFGSDCHIADP